MLTMYIFWDIFITIRQTVIDTITLGILDILHVLIYLIHNYWIPEVESVCWVISNDEWLHRKSVQHLVKSRIKKQYVFRERSPV